VIDRLNKPFATESGVKRTSRGLAAMSAYDAVDGAHPTASKCNTELASKRRWAIQGVEDTAGSGIDDTELKVLTNWRGHEDVMQIRSLRGSGEPAWVGASLNACLRLGPDPRKALWPAATPAAQTGRTHDRTRPMLQKRQKVLARAPSTHDPLQTSALEICCSVNRLPKPFVGWSVGNFNPVARCQPCSSGWCATEQPE
jgi:hypothetical protein